MCPLFLAQVVYTRAAGVLRTNEGDVLGGEIRRHVVLRWFSGAMRRETTRLEQQRTVLLPGWEEALHDWHSMTPVRAPGGSSS